MTKYEELQGLVLTRQYTWDAECCAGFICSNFPDKLLVLDQKVFGLDNFETGYQHNFIRAVKCSARTNGESVELLKQVFAFSNDDLS